MTKEEAEALAAKREAHKSKHLTAKVWQAVHNSVKGWHPALVDSREHLLKQHEKHVNEAREAILKGDAEGFVEAAGEALMAKVRAQLSQQL